MQRVVLLFVILTVMPAEQKIIMVFGGLVLEFGEVCGYKTGTCDKGLPGFGD